MKWRKDGVIKEYIEKWEEIVNGEMKEVKEIEESEEL